MVNKKIVIFGMVLMVMLAGLAGCNTGIGAATADGRSSININSQQGIWVNGQGKVTVTPDLATVSLGISARAATVNEAQAQASTAMDKVMQALTAGGIDKKDIQTQYFNINPEYRFDNPTQQSIITGYSVTNIVTAKIRAIDKTGSLIDSIAAAGGNYTRINGISFWVEQPEKYYSQARTLAMEDAKTKAQNLASLAGVSLGKVVYVSESSSSQPVPAAPIRNDTSGGTPPTTSVSPGQTDITLYVQAAYAIQ